MRTKYGILVATFFISIATFAQKDELKSAEKSLKGGHSYEAQRTLDEIEYMITNADDLIKAQFYFLKGNALYDQSKQKVDTQKNLFEAARCYGQLIDIESGLEKPKYLALAKESLREIKDILFNEARADNDAKKFKESAVKLYHVYQLEKKDTVMLYYAAGSALNAQDYDLALEYYTNLKDINYSGKADNYYAKSKITEQEELFKTLTDRNLSVKIGTHTNPRNENLPSKRGEVYKYLTEILIQKGNIKEAKKSIVNARFLNPDDSSLIMAEANLYLKTNDFETYKKLVSELLVKNPKDADLFYNLGVISSKNKDGKAEAEKNYLKAIEINPNYKDAYMNLAVLKLEGEKDLVDQMNKLGMSAADSKKYDALKLKQQSLYKAALPYLEKAHELFVGDDAVKSTLMGVYNALDMTEKYKALKAKK